MSIEKLPSGLYRVRKQYNKKRRAIVFDHKPTKLEIDKAFIDKLSRPLDNHSMTFEEAATKMIKSKENVLSPTTLREYYSTLRRLSDRLKSKKSQMDVQLEINSLSADKSPKTVKNYHGFISSVLLMYRPDIKLNTKLPQAEKKTIYIPPSDKVKELIKASEGTMFEIPIMLGCFGMRRSEICALTMDDINGNSISINKAKVMDNDKKWVIKQTKTIASTRVIEVPQQVVDKIKEKGLYTGHPNSINDWMGNRLYNETNLQTRIRS